MKRIAALLIVLSCVFLLSAGTKTDEKKITAVKRSSTVGDPALEVQIRFMDSDNAEFAANADIGLPLNARDADYTVFSWVLSGNAWRAVTVSFTFSPMYREYEADPSKYIPYVVTMTPSSSRIGNTVIPVNSKSKAETGITTDFDSSYVIKYGDSFSATGTPLSVGQSNQSASITYNMSVNSIISQNGDEISGSSYDHDVCNFWNRMGVAVVHLGITADGEVNGNVVDDGIYYANVVVNVYVD